jgi:AraC-like DNA-binding protein
MKTLLVSLGIEYTYGRTLLAGIVGEARRNPGVRVRLARSQAEARALLETGERFHAVLGMIWDRAEADRLHRRVGRLVSFAHVGHPVADLHVALDDRAIGRLAAAELLSLGHGRLAVYQPESHWFCRERTAGFVEAAHDPPAVLRSLGGVDRWLGGGSPAGGFLASNDVAASELVGHCLRRGAGVPSPVSVLGVDDDEVYVHLGAKLLSSIRLPFRRMGAEAVRRVLAADFPGRSSVVLLEPVGVAHRETTSSAGSYPPLLRAFLDRLHRERPLPASVAAACQRWKLPRRSLELAASAHAGRSPGQLLRAERRRLAAQLAAEGYSRQEIAYETGYAQARSLARLQAPQ